MKTITNNRWTWIWMPKSGFDRDKDMVIFKNPTGESDLIYSRREIMEILQERETKAIPFFVLKEALKEYESGISEEGMLKLA